jgi:methionine-rich copper-binding protein CopC
MESMQPADGSTVAAPIEQVVLVYSQPPGVERVEITSPSGDSSEAATRQQGVRVIVPFMPEEAGSWMLRWTVVQTDGHSIEYERSLTVAPSAIPRSAANDVLDALARTWIRILELVRR